MSYPVIDQIDPEEDPRITVRYLIGAYRAQADTLEQTRDLRTAESNELRQQVWRAEKLLRDCERALVEVQELCDMKIGRTVLPTLTAIDGYWSNR